MVELVLVGGRAQLDAVADEVPVKFDEQTAQGQVVWRDATVEVSLVLVAEGQEAGRHHPRVVVVDSDQNLDAVLLVQLLHNLCDSVRGQVRSLDTCVHDVQDSLGVFQCVTQTVLHRLVVGFKGLHLSIKKLVLPVVRPGLAFFVPVARAGLGVTVLPASHVHFPVQGHINRKILNQLLILGLKIL